MMMTTRLYMLTLSLLCALLLCCPCALAEEAVFAADMRLEKTEGSVELTNQAGRTLSLREGMKLYSGYQVSTGDASCAYIRLDADRVVKLDANTAVSLLKQDQMLELTLKSGGLFFDLNKPLEEDEALNVRTTTMVTGIRGTSGMVLHFEQDDIKALMDYWQLYSEQRPLRIEDLMTGSSNMLTFIGVMDGQVETVTADGQNWPIGAGQAGVVIITGMGAEKRMVFFDMSADDVPLFAGVEIIEGSDLWNRISEEMTQLKPEDILDSVRDRQRLTLDEARSLTECGCTDPVASTVPALAATCEMEGYASFERCTVCGGRLGALITEPALGHKETILRERKATCTRSGRAQGVACSRCGAVLKYQQYLRALGHDPIIGEDPIDPTCTEVGYTAYSYCSRCEAVLQEQAEIPALGHDPITGEDPIDPTCTEVGYTAYSYCSRCEEVLQEQTEIPALGHDPIDEAAIDPTCTEVGYTAHSYCSRCEEVLQEQAEIPALGHDPIIGEDPIDPTCTEVGYTAHSYCSRCEAVLQEQTEIPALGHDLSEWFCDESIGKHYRDCMQDCGYSEEGVCADQANMDGYCDVCGGPVGLPSPSPSEAP